MRYLLKLDKVICVDECNDIELLTCVIYCLAVQYMAANRHGVLLMWLCSKRLNFGGGCLCVCPPCLITYFQEFLFLSGVDLLREDFVKKSY